MENLKQLFATGKQKMRKLAAPALGSGAMILGIDAHAAYTPPAPATAAWTEMGEAFTWVEGNMWTVGAAVVLGFFVFKLFKKGANKVA